MNAKINNKTAQKNHNSNKNNDTFIERILENIDLVKADDWEQYIHHPIMDPCNLVTKKKYQGFNVMALYLDTLVKGFTSANYATFKCISKAGGKLKKGAKGCVIEFFSFLFKDPITHKIISMDEIKKLSHEEINKLDKQSISKNYVVFNSEYIENFSDLNLQIIDDEIENEEFFENKTGEVFLTKIIKNGLLDLRFSNISIGYYSPTLDQVVMPRKKTFISKDKYYSTLFHEVIHWTGHEKRLNRNLSGHSDILSYSFEELIAEMGSMLCCFQFGILSEFINSVRYLKGWKDIHQSDKETLLRKAFIDSKKAKKYLENL